MGGCLYLKYMITLFWSPNSKFKIWIRSDKWWLSYNPFPQVVFHRRPSSIGGCLPLEVVFILRTNKIWFGHPSLSLKF
jgi:hypothetical protein